MFEDGEAETTASNCWLPSESSLVVSPETLGGTK